MSGRVVKALELAVKSWDTDWEPDDQERDLLDPLKAALPIAKAQEAVIEAARDDCRRFHHEYGRSHSAVCASLSALDELEEGS